MAAARNQLRKHIEESLDGVIVINDKSRLNR